EFADPLVGGRTGEADLPGQLRIRDPAVVTEQFEDAPVGGVHGFPLPRYGLGHVSMPDTWCAPFGAVILPAEPHQFAFNHRLSDMTVRRCCNGRTSCRRR